MKRTVLLLFLISITSCIYIRNDDDDVITEPYESAYEPIIITRSEFENSTALSNAIANEKSGKIYLKDNFLIINEVNKGFHIYNNSNPENPIKIGFLKVLGSTDLSIKGDVAYANNAVDLIAIKINTTFNEIEVTKRIRNVFPEKTAPDGFRHTNDDEVVLDWILKTN